MMKREEKDKERRAIGGRRSGIREGDEGEKGKRKERKCRNGR